MIFAVMKRNQFKEGRIINSINKNEGNRKAEEILIALGLPKAY
jgi:hypothetical protein